MRLLNTTGQHCFLFEPVINYFPLDGDTVLQIPDIGEIFTNLQSDHLTYPIEAALGDLQRYRQAGTLAAAIVGVADQAQLAERVQGEIARDKGQKLFSIALPDSEADQTTIVLPLSAFVVDSQANLDRYIAEARALGIAIDTSVDAESAALTEIGDPRNLEKNKAILAKLGL